MKRGAEARLRFEGLWPDSRGLGKSGDCLGALCAAAGDPEIEPRLKYIRRRLREPLARAAAGFEIFPCQIEREQGLQRVFRIGPPRQELAAELPRCRLFSLLYRHGDQVEQ